MKEIDIDEEFFKEHKESVITIKLKPVKSGDIDNLEAETEIKTTSNLALISLQGFIEILMKNMNIPKQSIHNTVEETLEKYEEREEADEVDELLKELKKFLKN